MNTINDLLIIKDGCGKKNGLKKDCHPLCAYNGIETIIIDNSLSFTPNDCSVLWLNRLYDVFDDIDEDGEMLDSISPDEYFKGSGMLSLDDCRDYAYTKNKMIELSMNILTTSSTFDSFKVKKDTKSNKDFISFIHAQKR